MRIAVTYENGEIFQHFGHTERFKVYDVEGGRVSVTAVVNTNGSGHGALADILKKLQVDTLICGAMGNADDAVAALLNGTLAYNPAVQCSHHGAHHECGEHGCKEHEEAHACGSHACGGHDSGK